MYIPQTVRNQNFRESRQLAHLDPLCTILRGRGEMNESMVMDLWWALACGPLIVCPCQSKLQPRTIAQPPPLWAVSTEGGCTV